jgi:hypothetical protein
MADSSASSASLNYATEVPLRPSSAVPGMPGMPGMVPGLGMTANGELAAGYNEANYAVFDPLNWMLDGLVDFPYTFSGMGGLETTDVEGVGNIT